MSDDDAVQLRVNGEEHRLAVDPSTPLALVLRNQLGLTATKVGCGLEQCGACAVLVDGTSTLSCASPVGSFRGRSIVTCEGLADADRLSPVQQAFVDAGAGQCGYCIPGLVIAVTALLDAHPTPTPAQIRDTLTPHLCRCGAHPRILRAIERLSAAPR